METMFLVVGTLVVSVTAGFAVVIVGVTVWASVNERLWRNDILDFLQQNPGSTGRQIRDALKYGAGGPYMRLHAMERDGEIRSEQVERPGYPQYPQFKYYVVETR